MTIFYTSRPCADCSSTRSRRMLVNLIYEMKPLCIDGKACAKREKVRRARVIAEGCGRGEHPMYQNGFCVYCGAPDLADATNPA